MHAGRRRFKTALTMAGPLLLFAALATGAWAGEPLPQNQATPPSPKAAPRTLRKHTPKKALHRWPGQGHPDVERVRKCILRRESGGNYHAVDPKRRWFGAYQFEPPTSDTAARRMKRPDLVGLTADQWKPADQDAAFYVIYDQGRGRAHWAGGRYPCE